MRNEFVYSLMISIVRRHVEAFLIPHSTRLTVQCNNQYNKSSFVRHKQTTSFLSSTLHDSGGNGISTPIIPKELLFGNLEYRIPQISPDGQYLAYLAPNYNDGSCCYIHLRKLTLEENNESSVNNIDEVVCPDNRIHHFFWAEDSRTILYYANGDFKAGNEAFHLWRVEAVTVLEQMKLFQDPITMSSPYIREKFDYNSYIMDLTPGRNIKAQNVITNPNFEHLCFVATNQRNQTLFDVYKCNIYTGELTLDTLNPGDVIFWGSDVKNKESFEITYALAKSPTDASTTIRVKLDDDNGHTEKHGWRNLYSYPYGDLGKFISFCDHGKCCWITTSCDRDKIALIKINANTGKQVKMKSGIPIEFSDDKSDICDIFLDPNNNEVVMISFNYARRDVIFLDESLKKHYMNIISQGPVESIDEVRVVSRNREDTSWIVSYEPSDGPVFFTLYCTNNYKIKPLFCSQSNLLQYVTSMSLMDVVSITTRDSLRLVGYLTKPKCNTNQFQKFPLVLLVHGGPWERDYRCFNPTVQWLANRGYAVLQVNFRGSTGYGKNFLHLGDRQWGIGNMQNDLSDSVKWCIDQGFVDENKVCIFGSSYGGYACLSGLCFTPELYKCGVDIAGVSDTLFVEMVQFFFFYPTNEISSSKAKQYQIINCQHSFLLGATSEINENANWAC